MELKKYFCIFNASIIVFLAIYFIGSLCAWSFDPTTWWCYTSWGGRFFFGVIIGFLGYSIYLNSKEDKINEAIDKAPLVGHILTSGLLLGFCFLLAHYIFNI